MFAYLNNQAIVVLLSKGWRYAGSCRPTMALYCTLFVVAQGLMLIEPWLIGQMLNCLQTAAQHTAASGMKLWYGLCIYLAMFFFLQVGFWVFHGPGRIMERLVAFHIKANYKAHLFEMLTQLPLQWHRDHHSGENIDKVNRASNSLAEFFDDGFEISYMLFRLVGSQIILFWLMPFAGWIGLVTTAVSFAVVLAFDKHLYRQYQELNILDNSVASAVHDYVTNIGSVITLRLETSVLNEVKRRMALPLPLFKINNITNEVKWCIITFLIASMTLVVLGYYSYREISLGHIILGGTFFAIFEYLRRIGESFYNFAYLYGQVVRRAANVEGTDNICGALATKTPGTDSCLPRRWRRLQISDLHFTYEDEKHREHHLEKVCIALEKGKAIALVGNSGSGKSTLLSLLRGVQDAERVTVECDGQVLPGQLRHLAKTTTLIPQEPECFSDTILFNITFGLEADQVQVARAIELAQLGPVLARLPDGLNTDIAEKGVNLSGGERQRLSLARGIYFARDSEIVLLDEPTSNVDVANERAIYVGLLRQFRDRCVVSVIHRLHLLEMFDYIYVFDDGRVVEEGGLQALLHRQGHLAEMFSNYRVRAGVNDAESVIASSS